MRRTWMRGWAMTGVCLTLSGCGLLGREPRETPEARQLRQADETRIRQEIEARLAAEPSLGAGRIRVVVSGGDVQLHGSVVGFGALQCALANAELTPGVRLVIDQMELLPGPREVRCLAPRVFAPPRQAPGGNGP
jgi:hypothetical protein